MTNPLNDIIRDHAMLVSVHIKHWSGQVKDKEAERAAALSSGAGGADAYKAVKNLMFRHDTKLKAVLKEGNAVRALHNEMTMAWDSGKSPYRMLPTVTFMEYTGAVSKAKARYEATLKAFMDSYLVDARAARVELNLPEDPASIRLYPSEESLAQRFGVTLEFEPVAEGQTFKNIPPSAATALTEAFERRVSSRYADALGGARAGLVELLAALRGKLREPTVDERSQRWHDTSITNVVAAAGSLKTFCLEDNPELDEVCSMIVERLGAIAPGDMTSLRRHGEDAARLALADDITVHEVLLENLDL